MNLDPDLCIPNLTTLAASSGFPPYKIALYIGLVILFVFLHGFFSCTETAFACLNKFEYKVKADEGDKRAKLIVKLYDYFDTTLISVLIGNNVMSILISMLATSLFLYLFNGIISEYYVSLIASIAMAFLIFFFGDTVPKFLGKKIPEKMANINVYPMAVCIVLFFPLTFVLKGISWVFKHLFRTKQEPMITETDLKFSVEEKEEKGELEHNETDLIVASLDFDDTYVKEVLTPKRRMVMIDAVNLNNKKLVEFLKTTPFSRIPVYKEDKDNVIGVLIVKNFLAAYFNNPLCNFMAYVYPPFIVKPNVKLDDLLEGFKKNRVQIAIVKKDDELIGMVTLEDVLEELVGNIKETGIEFSVEENE